jgi:hypothetical protein
MGRDGGMTQASSEVVPFAEVAPGMTFHFVGASGVDRESYVKIDPIRARAQAGGAVLEAPLHALVQVVSL